MTQRGTHPNSLANLRPAWTKGQQPARPSTGPIISPALRRFANLKPTEFIRLPLDRMTVGENIAWVMCYLATQSDTPGSEKARSEVINRLDGMQKADVIVNAADGSTVNVALIWGSGEQA